jgi:hypothetical protein
LAKAAPLAMAATIALAMSGPMPGTVISCRQPEEARFWRATRESMDGIREWYGEDNHLD